MAWAYSHMMTGRGVVCVPAGHLPPPTEPRARRALTHTHTQPGALTHTRERRDAMGQQRAGVCLCACACVCVCARARVREKAR